MPTKKERIPARIAAKFKKPNTLFIRRHCRPRAESLQEIRLFDSHYALKTGLASTRRRVEYLPAPKTKSSDPLPEMCLKNGNASCSPEMASRIILMNSNLPEADFGPGIISGLPVIGE